MSPLWRNRIGVELSPQRVAWVRMARGLPANVIAKGFEDVMPQGNEPLWQAALTKLEQMLRGEGWKNADVTVVLSNHFVRYDCLPWNEAVTSDDEQIALARHRLMQIYGAVAQTWAVRLSPAAKGAVRLIAAMDNILLEKLKAAVVEANLKLYSIQPCLMASFNHFARNVTTDNSWFVVAENGRFALALLRDGQWQRIRLRRGAGAAALHEWLERESLADGNAASSREVFLFGLDEREAVLPSYQLHRLELSACRGYSPLTDTQYLMAMSGVAG